MWFTEPSALEIAEQRNCMIFEGGLRECAKQLGSALANLQMNPRDSGALKKVEQLAMHFARYLKPSDEGNLRELQSKILKPLEERVSILAHLRMKNALSKLMPVFFQGNKLLSERGQTEHQLARERRSQVMQEFPEAKAKPPQKNGFEMTDRAGTDNGHYYSCQLKGVRNCLSYLDARLLKLFSIFPGVSAEPVKLDEYEVAVLGKDDQKLGAARVKTAYIAYVGWVSASPSKAGTVIAIDTDSNTVIANVTVGIGPRGIAITPDSLYAYVINENSYNVSVIYTYNNTVVGNFEAGTRASSIAITPNGQYAYVLNEEGNGNRKISVIETASNIVKTTIFPPALKSGRLSRIAITPNGLYVYVTGDTAVSVIETINNTVLTSIDVGGPLGIAITPDGLYAYVANSGQTVSVINTTSNAVVAKVALGVDPSEIAITPNGLYAYVTSYYSNHSVSVIETTNNTVLTTIKLKNMLTGIAITPDGLYAYVTDSNSIVSVINTKNNTVIAIITFDSSEASQGFAGIAITPVKMPIPTTREDTGLIIGLSCGAVFIILSGVGGYLTYRWLKKKEEDPRELNNLINPLSPQQKMIFL
jgi:YVTN family beta-propeller protein